jgi:hypothetical protein
MLPIVLANVLLDHVNESIQAGVCLFPALNGLSRFFGQLFDLTINTISVVVALDIRQTQNHVRQLRDIGCVLTACFSCLAIFSNRACCWCKAIGALSYRCSCLSPAVVEANIRQQPGK